MALRKTIAAHFSPMGLTDTIDPTDGQFQGCTSLQNLIPHPTTKGVFIARPPFIGLGALLGGPITVMLAVGTRIYGMYQSPSGGFNGFDQPFCYDTVAGALVAITGPSGTNLPSHVAVGNAAYFPPVMAVIGVYVTLTHPGFSGANYVGWINTGNPAALTWTAGNTATTALVSRPTWVAAFNDRAYYIVLPTNGQPGLYASDALNPTTITNANYILTFDDNIPLTCAAPLQINNAITGIQTPSLIVFKSATTMYQVTGDPATGSSAGAWTSSALSVPTGTFSPRTVVPTPAGLAFLAPDGLRIVDQNGKISLPIGEEGAGVTSPFYYQGLYQPLVCAAAANGSLYRLSINQGVLGLEYWYDLNRKIWTGPHTACYFALVAIGNTFYGAPSGYLNSPVTASTNYLSQTDYVYNPFNSGYVYTENANPVTCIWTSSYFSDMKDMAEYTMVETEWFLSLDPTSGVSTVITAIDELGTTLATYSVLSPNNHSNAGLYPLPINWSLPLVFRRLRISATGPAGAGTVFGALDMRLQKLGYMQQFS